VKKLADSGQNNIVDNEMKLRYYETSCLEEKIVYMGNPGGHDQTLCVTLSWALFVNNMG